jgi:hypothetical protein
MIRDKQLCHSNHKKLRFRLSPADGDVFFSHRGWHIKFVVRNRLKNLLDKRLNVLGIFSLTAYGTVVKATFLLSLTTVACRLSTGIAPKNSFHQLQCNHRAAFSNTPQIHLARQQLT